MIDIYQIWRDAEILAIERQEQRKSLSTRSWWKEHAGVFVLYPRQVGKTTALARLSNQIKNRHPSHRTVAVTPYSSMISNFEENFDIILKANTGTSWLYSIDARTDHLLVDEFMHLPEGCLSTLLQFDWRSVTMIGSMK